MRDFLRGGGLAAVKLAHEPAMKGKMIVVILPDSGERYLSSALVDVWIDALPRIGRVFEGKKKRAPVWVIRVRAPAVVTGI